jgi:hypothetical protein
MNSLDARHHYFGQRDDLNVGMPAVIHLRGVPGRDDVEATFARAAALIPRMRQLAQPVRANLARPRWIDAEGFAARNHITWIDCRGASTSWEIDRIQSAPFDVSKPLWTAHVLVDATSCTVVLRLHHSIADGAALTAFFTEVFNGAGDSVRSVEPAAQAAASGAGGVICERASAVRSLIRSGPAVAAAAAQPSQRSTMLALAAGFLASAPSGRIGRHRPSRTARMFSVELQTWKDAAHRAGGTVNDLFVALAGVTLEMGGQVDRGAVARLVMPVDTRGTPGEDLTSDNRTGLGVIEVRDRLESLDDLRSIHDACRLAKQSAIDPPPPVIDQLLDLLPGGLQAAIALRLYSKTDALTTNLVGPAELRLAGVGVDSVHVLATTIGTPVGFALFTTGARCHVSVNCDAGIVDDPEHVHTAFGEALTNVFGDAVVRVPWAQRGA